MLRTTAVFPRNSCVRVYNKSRLVACLFVLRYHKQLVILIVACFLCRVWDFASLVPYRTV